MLNKEDLKEGLKFAYQSRSATLLEEVRTQALQQGHYDVAEKAVRCMNALANPFTLYN